MTHIAHEIRELAQKATPRPWKMDGLRKSLIVSDNAILLAIQGHPSDAHFYEDADLVVYLANHADQIADLLEAGTNLRDSLRIYDDNDVPLEEIAAYDLLAEGTRP